MLDASDSDDSALLFTTKFSKRKLKNVTDQSHKSNNDKKSDPVNLNEQIMEKEGELIIEYDSSISNMFIPAEFEKEILERSMPIQSMVLENDNLIQQKTNIIPSKVTNYSCPLCCKTFDAEIPLVSHMKQCAKKSKMTPKQLLEALKMHKDQLKKRIDTGLSLSSSPLKKKKKTENILNSKSSYELALGLALSKSISEGNPNHLTSFNTIRKNNRTTLESFGFISSGCNFGVTGRKKPKNWKNTQFLLRERTQEERERLITEKAAVILLSKNYEVESFKNTKQMESCDLEFESNQEVRENESLWKLGEMENNKNWYVKEVKEFILEEIAKNVNEERTLFSEECEIVEEIKKLNLPRLSAVQNWKKLINNRHLSDLSFQSKSCETFYLHSVLVYVRCPTMLDLDLQNVFSGFSTGTILLFLQYLYCGVLDGLKRSDINNLYNLAQSVNFEELGQVLHILKENLNMKFSETNEIILEMNKSCQKPESEEHDLEENLSPYSNSSLQENIEVIHDYEDDKNKSNQEFLNCPQNKGESFCKQNQLQKHDNRAEIGGKVEVTLNGEYELSCSHKNTACNQGLSNQYTEIHDLESDMFEEANVSNQINKISDSLNINAYHFEENENKCILVSNGSSIGGLSDEETREELTEKNEDFPVTVCEIPYFDPYEHFNNEIPVPDSPCLNEEQIIRSQSLFLNEISPSKLISPNRRSSPLAGDKNISEVTAGDTVSPGVIPSTSEAPDFCSTPIIRPDTSALISNRDISQRKSLKRRQKWTNQPSCFKKNRSVIASRLMKTTLLKSNSVRKKRKISKEAKLDSENMVNILTESILKDLNNSLGIASEETPESRRRKFIEVTPSVCGEEFSDEVSPLPDYSIMNASTIKKHLKKYGLKKSLSKNKAKKILRHIYEELHPLVNTKTGKIIKYEQKEKGKRIKKSERKRRKSGKDKKLQLLKEESESELRASERTCKNSYEDSSEKSHMSIRSESQDASFICTNTLDRSEHIFERSDSEQLSQSHFSSDMNVTEAVFNFIYNNPEIRRRILMYEPIWLENFREQLYEEYNKKFKLTDIMDCLDAECITFRCESQGRMNRLKRFRRTNL